MAYVILLIKNNFENIIFQKSEVFTGVLLYKRN